MNELPINIYLDLSKASDTLDHSIIIHKLKFYGIEGNSLKIFQNYLSKRKQFVEFENVHSEVLDINIGVPQGSVLGPLLFTIYVNDISKASKLFEFISYADDTTLTSTLKKFGNTENSVVININNELTKIGNWLKMN